MSIWRTKPYGVKDSNGKCYISKGNVFGGNVKRALRKAMKAVERRRNKVKE